VAEPKNVTRIKATESTTKKKPVAKAEKATKLRTKTIKTPKTYREPTEPSNWFTKALFGIGRYFKGAWIELKQVRWPTRKATWGLTVAVILFSVFFVVLILLLDAFFKYIFELMIK